MLQKERLVDDLFLIRKKRCLRDRFREAASLDRHAFRKRAEQSGRHHRVEQDEHAVIVARLIRRPNACFNRRRVSMSV